MLQCWGPNVWDDDRFLANAVPSQGAITPQNKVDHLQSRAAVSSQGAVRPPNAIQCSNGLLVWIVGNAPFFCVRRYDKMTPASDFRPYVVEDLHEALIRLAPDLGEEHLAELAALPRGRLEREAPI